jgi:hypothetical protein
MAFQNPYNAPYAARDQNMPDQNVYKFEARALPTHLNGSMEGMECPRWDSGDGVMDILPYDVVWSYERDPVYHSQTGTVALHSNNDQPIVFSRWCNAPCNASVIVRGFACDGWNAKAEAAEKVLAIYYKGHISFQWVNPNGSLPVQFEEFCILPPDASSVHYRIGDDKNRIQPRFYIYAIK